MTAPLVPVEVNLRGLPWMRLDTERLLNSDMFALSTGDEFKAAVALWCKSWTQQPAASLPTDDRILAHLSGAGKNWRKLKAMALHGWIECDDGRLYHPVVAEQALLAWEERLEYRGKAEASADRKRREREDRARLFALLKSAGHAPAWNTTTTELREMAEQVTDLSRVTGGYQSLEKSQTSHGLDTAKTGRDGSKEQEQDQKPKSAPARAPSPEPPATVQPPTEAGRACLLMRQAGCIGTNPSHPALHAAIAEGISPETLADTVREAIDAGVSKPFAWAIATARSRHAEGARPISTGPPQSLHPPQSRRAQAVQALNEVTERVQLQRRQFPSLDSPSAQEGTSATHLSGTGWPAIG